jgi:hypothetical protein
MTIITVARPAILLRHGRQARLYRIQMNVTNHCGQILISVDHNRLVAASKQRTVAAMGPVESLRVYPVDVAHDPRKVAFRCSKTKVIVVTHWRIGEDFDSSQPKSLCHGVEDDLAVPVVGKRPARRSGRETRLYRGNHANPTSVELNLHRLTVFLPFKHPFCAALLLSNPHSRACVLLRGLVQHVLSARCACQNILELDCLQALGIKGYTFGVLTVSLPPFFSKRRGTDYGLVEGNKRIAHKIMGPHEKGANDV